MQSARFSAAAMALDFLRHEAQPAWEAFMAEFSDSGDPLIDELYDMIEHMPQRGGFMGVSEAEYQAYRADIASLAERCISDQ